MDLSLVISLYNEEASIGELVDWIGRALAGEKSPAGGPLSYEIILVDDGSTDGSWKVITDLAAVHPEIRAVRFRRNYGKSAALYEGFDAARGDIVVTLDADLQDNPEEIPEMMRMIREEGYDLVSGWKKKRYDGKLSKNIPSKIYNWTARKVTGLSLHDMNCGLKAYRRDVVKNIEVYGEMHRYIPFLAKNAGFGKIGEKVVHHQARKYGTTKFGLDRFVNGYLDLMSLWFLNRFGKQPMHFFGLWGSVMFVLCFIAIIVIGASKLYAISHGIRASLITDNPYFYLALTGMLMGTLMFLAGFLAELVSRSSQNRNDYKIEKELK